MKKILLLFAVMAILIPLHSVLSQTLNDYVKQVKGDTLVIKDYYDMNNQPNSLYWAMTLDTGNVPAGRAYELKANGYYPLVNNPTTIRKTVIVGADNRIIINNDDTGSAPPLICGAVWQGGSNPGGINAAHDLIIKNCNIIPANAAGVRSFGGFLFANNSINDIKITFDNCLLENTWKIFVWINAANCNVTLRNCYFANMSGYPCRRSGGVFDCFAILDTLLVENCTHIMAQGSMYRLRGHPSFPQNSYQFKRIIFNHNIFVNCAGYIFMNPGLQNNISLTNNIFVNCNIQGFAPILATWDVGEVDPDKLPMGLVNVYPDSAELANNTPRKFLCQNNLAYWDPSLADMDSILNANAIDGLTNWKSQKIVMNTRTESMFKHEEPYNTTPYSYLVTDTWKSQLPTFTDSKDLFTIQLANLKTFALSTVDSTSGYNYVLPIWRLINTGSDDFLKSDWPIPVDLSYSDATLLTGATNGFPVGDLNWFPAQKTAWLAQKDAEYAYIQSYLDQGLSGIKEIGDNVTSKFSLDQNYPNPFNPSTIINFTIPKSGHVTLKIYNMLGQEVATLLDGFKSPQTYNLKFEGTGLASGVYFYRLTAPGFNQVKKMVLTK